jgi:bifunctional non-homologous end joining protein LigD
LKESVSAEIMRRIEPLRIDASPFVNTSTRELKGAVFCKPEVAIEAGYRELTPDGKLRHSSYIGIREDL